MSGAAIQFGTDGWRGIIADDFTFDNVRKVAGAAALYFKSHAGQGDGSILVGYDRRFLSREFAREAARVMASQGCVVRISQNPLPTPAISFSVTRQKSSWGVVLTASHNPAHYNGFKIKDGLGRSAPPQVTREIEAIITVQTADRAGHAAVPEFDDSAAYEKYLRQRLDWKMLRNYRARVVFDYLYGVGAGIPERVLAGSKVSTVSLHSALDPLFGGLHPEPIDSQLGDLKKEVRRQRAAVGIALDGDADRLGIVDDKGRYLTPHQVFPLLVLHCIEHKGWKGKIVQAVSLGYLSERIARAYNLAFEEVPVGFKHVAERMLDENFLAGGEESGGYAVRGGLPERDGILNGLLFLEMMAASRRAPSKLLRDLEKRFGSACFLRVDIGLERPILDRAGFVQRASARVPDRLAGESVAEVRTRDGVKIVLKSGSWVLMRPSGTEPLVRTYAESDHRQKTERLLHWAKQVALSPSRNVQSDYTESAR